MKVNTLLQAETHLPSFINYMAVSQLQLLQVARSKQYEYLKKRQYFFNVPPVVAESWYFVLAAKFTFTAQPFLEHTFP
jgi:hypothetical protein